MRQQVIGNATRHVVDVAVNGDAENDPADLIEGKDDIANCQSAPRRRTNNSTRRHVQNGFSASSNDPSSRFNNIVQGFQSLDALTRAITTSVSAPAQRLPCLIVDVVCDFAETKTTLSNAISDKVKVR